MDQIAFTGPFEVLSRILDSTIHVIAKSEVPGPRQSRSNRRIMFGVNASGAGWTSAQRNQTLACLHTPYHFSLYSGTRYQEIEVI
jgi:hypothetical protein